MNRRSTLVAPFGAASGKLPVSRTEQMLDVPPGDYGPEFYVGDTSVIADVCSSTNWDALRSGKLTVAHAIFPSCICSLDVLLLPEAISNISGNPISHLPDDVVTITGVEGLWGACVLPPEFVSALASIRVDSARQLQAEWMRIYIREYEPEAEDVDPDWLSIEVLNATTALLSLANIAIRGSHDVIEIWTL
jgi:hypothetical protein